MLTPLTVCQSCNSLLPIYFKVFFSSFVSQSGPITVLGGLQDYEIACDDLESWREQTNGSFSMQMFQGDHFFINSNQSTLLQFLNRELSAVANRINLA